MSLRQHLAGHGRELVDADQKPPLAAGLLRLIFAGSMERDISPKPSRENAQYYQMTSFKCSSSSNRSISTPVKSLRETTPRILPFSATGRCRKPPSFMARNASIAELSGVIVTGFLVIASARRVAAAFSTLASTRTASRPVNMPDKHCWLSTTRVDPLLCLHMERHAC